MCFVMISDAAGIARLERALRLRRRGTAMRRVCRAPAVRDPGPALAYHTPVLKGTDVDQPRNPAKKRDGVE
jgi:glucosamine 6-phosphate synthetase-like amidotransferase/phosphosugar isomerase protein